MKTLAIVAFLPFLALSGCGSAEMRSSTSAISSNRNVSYGIYDLSAMPAGNAAQAAESSVSVQPSNTGGGGGGGRQEESSVIKQTKTLSQAEQSKTDRKIIRNAEVGLESDSPEEAQKQITSIAESKGGFVVESQQSSSDARITTRDVVAMTLRVPAENFASTLDEIRKAAKRVVVETVKGQDVTEEFVDIEADLKAKKALEAQFMEIMKRANTVEEALDVQRQLAEVRGEIEKIEGRKRFLENQSALSTIKVRIQTPAAISASSTGFGDRFTESFSDGLNIALNFILGLVTLVIGALPFALFIGLPVFLIGRHFWRKQSRPKSVSEIAKEEIESE